MIPPLNLAAVTHSREGPWLRLRRLWRSVVLHVPYLGKEGRASPWKEGLCLFRALRKRWHVFTLAPPFSCFFLLLFLGVCFSLASFPPPLEVKNGLASGLLATNLKPFSPLWKISDNTVFSEGDYLYIC